ncbi:MAG: hypothetical protein HZB85_00105 [Deltaproteobacteria bacterium]|nr:hypothetical protein [Deltaproteobacteria bacterium]
MTYESQWADLRKRRNIFWFILLTYLPVVGLVVVLSRILSITPVSAAIAAVAWVVAYAVAAWRLASFRCPGCGGRYHVKGWWQNPLASRCLHCGLPKWVAE